ncbi:LPXTG cell wall anchor domain-containing protein [Carnobacterium divergens]|uniref:LPXTG cell wall anchor domain-containing protein n=2 Tax=Bacilli TaxID=91061 RepID=UPI0007668C78|nr:LPXTG cell wall anchor domain-containing protein [Carnobacterium divergens]ODE62551.1 hypothetical protein BB610_03285 [Listeria monocytogenes]ODE90766.1 hypothetical protein BB582_03510 [Listeria monocytogenes]ODE91969.1 hypothetical protein BB578_11710 [Listeria monocytogenes]ODE99155.1 hypothetical protein BB577_03630 [Listeria monocytogenes]CWU72985.1 Serine-aspartate repeat-containing protein D precursor [Listeria monocytogenes]
MKTKSKSLLRKMTTYIMVLVTICGTFFTSSTSVHASDLVLNEPTAYSYTGVSPHLGYAITHNPIYVMKMDGKKVFCVESGIFTTTGGGYIPESYISPKKDILSKIAYYGYTNTGQSHYDYVVTQVMIWEELGDQYVSSTIPNYQQRKAEIMAMVNRHDTLPSWHNQEVKVTVGESITLADSHGVLSGMSLESNNTNATLQQDGNNITITPNANSNDGSITYRKVPQNEVGTSIVYTKPQHQTLVEFHLESAKQATVKVDVIKLGNVQITKVDEETGRPLPDTTMKFEYNGTSTELVTDSNGIALIKDIPEGTKITITEVKAPNGYVNKGVSQVVTIEPNKTIELTFDNKEQLGIATLTKAGEEAKEIEVTESEYGDVHTFKYNANVVAGVTYRIEATQDIHSVDGTLKAKKGDTVATVTTDEKGQWHSPNLYLGEYQAVEVSAPAGYILDTRPIPFSLTYAGQEVELASTAIKATNEFQTLDLRLFKDEESILSWNNNQPEIEVIQGQEKVFGVFTREAQALTDEVHVPANALLGYQTVSDGVASFELKLPQGKYYLKELEAGTSHVLNDTEYDFEFTAENNNATYPIYIYQDTVAVGNETMLKIARTPIINKLHFNEFIIKKLNEQAIFDKESGVEFNYDGLGTGAIFTLENEDNEVIQEVTIDKDGQGNFKNIPVGTFYLKEKSASSTHYLMSEKVIRIESTKDGIKAFDEDDKLLGETSSTDEEPTILLEIENDLKKGTAELTKKDVSTGELLPNTGIRILDEEKNTIAEGRTDDKGIYTFEKLPAGKYYFQEYDAPTGYQLDDTPMLFEITENGEVVKCEMTNNKIPEKITSLPQTGDTTNITIFALGMLLSVSTLGVLYFRRKKAKIE